jgi:hypothetical protein
MFITREPNQSPSSADISKLEIAARSTTWFVGFMISYQLELQRRYLCVKERFCLALTN